MCIDTPTIYYLCVYDLEYCIAVGLCAPTAPADLKLEVDGVCIAHVVPIGDCRCRCRCTNLLPAIVGFNAPSCPLATLVM